MLLDASSGRAVLANMSWVARHRSASLVAGRAQLIDQ